MLNVELEHRGVSGTFTRRSFLRVGAAGMLLPSLPRHRSEASEASETSLGVRDTSVVLLTINGGPSQFETFDPKMSAPSEIRSITGEVQTSLPGITFGGTFPRLARLADKLAIIRSFRTKNGQHRLLELTRTLPIGDVRERPSWGSVYSRIAGSMSLSGMPRYALINPVSFDPALGRSFKRAGEYNSSFLDSTRSGSLGSQHAPFYPAGKGQFMENMTLRLPQERLADRMSLVRELDRLRQTMDSNGDMDRLDQYRQRAHDILLRGSAKAFSLEGETAETINRYDTSEYHYQNYHRASKELDGYTPKYLGKQMLLARRLCEAGCGFVMVDSFGWDMHSNQLHDQFGILEGMNLLGPALDKALSAFISDCEERGLSNKILLVVTGEMGRTPTINKNVGRDHWGELTPLLIYGGGLRMGQVIGRSDRRGGAPATDPYDKDHLAATIMRVLVDPGEVRLRRNLPADILNFIGSAEAIGPLFS